MIQTRLAVGTAIATWLLLVIGGLVNPMDASMACPDWYFVPTCNGELLPEMKGGVLYEHGHRLWASWVGLMTIAMAISLWAKRRVQPGLSRLGWFAVALVAFQGTLGGITVRMQLHPLVSTLHLATAMVFFLLVLYIAVCLWARARRPVQAAAVPAPSLRRAGFVLVMAAVAAQIVLGGAVRHLGAGLICGNDWLGCGPGMSWTAQPLAHLHMTHRVVGYLLIPAVLALSWITVRRAQAGGRGLAARWAAAPAALVIVQVLLGLLTVATGRSPWIVSLHTAVAALLLATMFVAFLLAGPEGAHIQRGHLGRAPRHA